MYNIIICNLRNNKIINKYDFRVDRMSILGNPFYMKNENERDLVCDKYEKYFYNVLLNNKNINFILDKMLEKLKENKEIRLFCWCAPKRCHAETIKKYLLNKLEKN